MHYYNNLKIASRIIPFNEDILLNSLEKWSGTRPNYKLLKDNFPSYSRHELESSFYYVQFDTKLDFVEIMDIHIKEHVRGRGFGKALVTELTNHFRDNNYSYIKFVLSTHKNLDSICEDLGYKFEGDDWILRF